MGDHSKATGNLQLYSFYLNAFKALEKTEEIRFRLLVRYVDSFHAKCRLYGTVEPRYNEVGMDSRKFFAITRYPRQELSHMFYYYWGKEKKFVILRSSSYRGSLYRSLTVFGLECSFHIN